VVHDPYQRTGVGVLEVVPGSPADEAGIRPADHILRIDGVSIGTLEELRSAVSEIGAARSVDVSRGGAEVNLTVIPRSAPKQRLTLFQRLPAPALERGAKVLLRACASHAVPFVLLGATWLWSRHRIPDGNRSWAWVLAAMATFLAIDLSAQGVIQRYVDGWAPAIAILGNLAGMLAYLTVGLLGLGMPPLGTGVLRTSGLGLLYGLVSGMRARHLSSGAALLLPKGSSPGKGPIEYFAPFTLDPAATLLLLANMIIVGPLAEEILFRGLLLPLLVPAFGPVGAVLLSSLIFASAHQGYGTMMIQVFAIGLVLGWARLRSGGLAAPFLLHALFNAVAAVPILL
jgi:membrane protease YdiL (CAAX protease family)